MFFWNSLAFLMIQQMLAIWSLVPLPFLKPAWTSGSSWFMYLLDVQMAGCLLKAEGRQDILQNKMCTKFVYIGTHIYTLSVSTSNLCDHVQTISHFLFSLQENWDEGLRLVIYILSEDMHPKTLYLPKASLRLLIFQPTERQSPA